MDSMPIPLVKADIRRAGDLFGRALHRDPFMIHLLPDAVRRAQLSPRAFRCVVRYGLSCGEVQTTSSDLQAVAVWLPPHATHPSVIRMALAGALAVPFTVGRRFFLGFLDFLEHVEKLKKELYPFPYWYLQLLGVEPSCQRQGYGSVLLRAMLDRFDRTGMSCGLDTENGDNVAYYKRFGFQVAAETKVPKTDVSVWLMIRKRAG
jgi:ribosomal protein S18 acetylase RimI-like enzyme